MVSIDELRVPIAVYDHSRESGSRRGFLLIQHGSYQWAECESQHDIEAGQVLLYRRVGQARAFRHLCFDLGRLSTSDAEVWGKYFSLQAEMLSDSVLSFNTIHDRTKRCETRHLRDGTWLSDHLAARLRLTLLLPAISYSFQADFELSLASFRFLGVPGYFRAMVGSDVPC